MGRFASIRWFAWLAGVAAIVSVGPASGADTPNILWLIAEDIGPGALSCYGEQKAAATPTIDRLAAEGTRFTRFYATCPVCSPSRSAFMTGMYQTTIGAHHHRSGRGELKIKLPGDVVPVPVLFQKAGYYTCIGGFNAKGDALGKTDYNFEWDEKMYDGNDWAGRKAGQPFFMQVQLHGGKYRHNKNWKLRALSELGSGDFIGIYADADHFAEVINVARLVQNERILQGMPDAVVLLGDLERGCARSHAPPRGLKR